MVHRAKYGYGLYAQVQEDKVQPTLMQINEQAAKLLMEDPNVCAYDQIYDDMKKEQQTKKTQQKQLQPNPASVPIRRFRNPRRNTSNRQHLQSRSASGNTNSSTRR